MEILNNKRSALIEWTNLNYAKDFVDMLWKILNDYWFCELWDNLNLIDNWDGTLTLLKWHAFIKYTKSNWTKSWLKAEITENININMNNLSDDLYYLYFELNQSVIDNWSNEVDWSDVFFLKIENTLPSENYYVIWEIDKYWNSLSLNDLRELPIFWEKTFSRIYVNWDITAFWNIENTWHIKTTSYIESDWYIKSESYIEWQSYIRDGNTEMTPWWLVVLNEDWDLELPSWSKFIWDWSWLTNIWWGGGGGWSGWILNITTITEDTTLDNNYDVVVADASNWNITVTITDDVTVWKKYNIKAWPNLTYTISWPVKNWSVKNNMPESRSNHTASEVDWKIYIIWWMGNNSNIDNNFEYNPETDTWTLKASMPTHRYSLSASVVNWKIYVIWWKDSTWNKVDINEEYDPINNTWTTKANININLKSHTSSSVNWKIYVIWWYGEINWTNTYLNINEEYDPISNTWTTKANLPTARMNLVSASYNWKIYVIWWKDSTWNSVDINEEYDPINNTWSTKEAMPTAREEMSASVLQWKIFVLWWNMDWWENEEYNPDINFWSIKLKLINRRKRHASASINDKLYVFGWYYVSIMSSVEEYKYNTIYFKQKEDFIYGMCCHTANVLNNKNILIIWWRKNDWTILSINLEFNPIDNTIIERTNMPTARGLHTSTKINNKIYVIWWNIDNNILTTKNEEYNIVTDTWTLKADIPTWRTAHAAWEINWKIYVVWWRDSTWNLVDINEEYDPTNNTWSIKTSMNQKIVWLKTFVRDNKLYTVWWRNADNFMPESNDIYIYDPNNDTWSYYMNFSYERFHHDIAVYNDILYIFGWTKIKNNNNYIQIWVVEKIDLSTNTYLHNEIADMILPRTWFTASVIDWKIYLICWTFWYSTNWINRIDEYNATGILNNEIIIEWVPIDWQNNIYLTKANEAIEIIFDWTEYKILNRYIVNNE